jgi:hypothetical protein
MADELVRTDSEELAQPGLLGRAIRASLGLATLSFLFLLLTVWRRELWAGEVPLLDLRFWLLVWFALWGTSYVFNIALGLSWGQKTRAGVLAGAGLAAVVGVVAGSGFPNAVLGVYLWAWFVAVTGLLGPAHLLAAALGTPGCEMRSYAHARTLLRGGDVGTVVCPGGIDRFDQIGAADREEVAG